MSDTSLMSTCRTLRVQKAAVDFFRELAATDGKVTVAMLEKLNGDLLNNEEMAAVYRKDIPIHRTYFHDIAQPEDIRGGLDDLLAWVNSKRRANCTSLSSHRRLTTGSCMSFRFRNRADSWADSSLTTCLSVGGYLVQSFTHQTARSTTRR